MICVVGTNSLLGHKIIHYNKNFEIIGTYHKNSPIIKDSKNIHLDITDEMQCKKIIEHKPDVIINTAALTNVDYCERMQDEATKVNVIGTRNLAKVANNIGSKFIHISSDGIFSGNKNYYLEDDISQPCNFYGISKFRSENEAALVSDHTILRPSVLFGWIPHKVVENRFEYVKSKNFALWVLSELAQKKSIRVVTDQFNTPTLADNLADVVLNCCQINIKGIFHASGLSCVSRYEFANMLARKFNYSEDMIIPIISNDLNQIAKRPNKTCLDCNKIKKFGINLLDLEESIKIMHEQINEEYPDLINS